MKRETLVYLSIFLLLGFGSTNCVRAQFIKGNGNVTKSVRQVNGIQSVGVGSGIDLYLSQGNQESLEIEADENLHEYLKTEMEGTHLKIYMEKWVRNSRTLKVYLTVKDLKGLKASGGSDVFSQSVLKLESLELKCSGGSDVNLDLEVGDLSVEISGGSDARLKGIADIFSAKTSGGSDLKAADLKTAKCTIEASGGSDAWVQVTGELEIHASGGSDVYYSGDPEKVNSKSSGGSDVHRK